MLRHGYPTGPRSRHWRRAAQYVGFLVIRVSNDWAVLGFGPRLRSCAVPLSAVSLQHCCTVLVALLLLVRAEAGAGRRGGRPLVCFVTQFPFTSAASHVSLAYKSC